MSSSTEIFSSSHEKLKAKSSNMRIHKRKLHDHQVQNNSPMKKQKDFAVIKTLLRISSTRRIAVIGSAPIAFDVTS
ncbi:hypothetical protein V6Z12_D07G104900 [Gossypium hirsutum]